MVINTTNDRIVNKNNLSKFARIIDSNINFDNLKTRVEKLKTKSSEDLNITYFLSFKIIDVEYNLYVITNDLWYKKGVLPIYSEHRNQPIIMINSVTDSGWYNTILGIHMRLRPKSEKNKLIK